MATIEAYQADTSVVYSSTASSLLASQSDTTVVFNLPSEEVVATQSDVGYVSKSLSNVEVSQADMMVIMSGRVFDPAVRAWTFTLDGHDFYVLRLGNDETLIFDLTTEQWHVWGSGIENIWSVYSGINWVGGNRFAGQFGTNILVGSDSNGSLYFLDPDLDLDSSAVTGRDPVPFRRRVTAQLPVRGYDNFSLYEVQLIGSIGDITEASLTEITLLYSDDGGRNYVSAGTIEVPEDAYEARAHWLSLGSFRSPGRLLRIQDEGSLRRIDSLTMNSDFGE